MIKFRLKILLAMREMNQRQLCDITGIRPSTLSDMNNGKIKQIPLEVIDKICDTLDCSVGDLIIHVSDEKETVSDKSNLLS